MILAIDPGPEESAILLWDGSKIAKRWVSNDAKSATVPNNFAMSVLRDELWRAEDPPWLHIEMIASYGMPVGKETFDTCLWIGRFWETWKANTGFDARLTYRQEVKMHLCQSMRAKDSNIRQALIDRFGPPGTKKQPGPLYGVKSHLWAALAIAVTAYDKTNASAGSTPPCSALESSSPPYIDTEMGANAATPGEVIAKPLHTKGRGSK